MKAGKTLTRKARPLEKSASPNHEMQNQLDRIEPEARGLTIMLLVAITLLTKGHSVACMLCHVACLVF